MKIKFTHKLVKKKSVLEREIYTENRRAEKNQQIPNINEFKSFIFIRII